MMKAFLVSVSVLCLCGILLCFFAYGTGRLPGVPVVIPSPQGGKSQATMETDPLCSPCVEKMAMLVEMVQEWEAETAQWGSVPDSQQVELEAEDECSPCEDNLKRLKEVQQRWERERNAQEAVAVSNTDDSP